MMATAKMRMMVACVSASRVEPDCSGLSPCIVTPKSRKKMNTSTQLDQLDINCPTSHPVMTCWHRKKENWLAIRTWVVRQSPMTTTTMSPCGGSPGWKLRTLIGTHWPCRADWLPMMGLGINPANWKRKSVKKQSLVNEGFWPFHHQSSDGIPPGTSSDRADNFCLN